MCIRDSPGAILVLHAAGAVHVERDVEPLDSRVVEQRRRDTVSYTHLRAHETVLDLVCRLLLENKKQRKIDDRVYTEQCT